MAKKKRPPQKARGPVITPEIVGIFLLALAVLTLCSLLSVSRGALTENWLILLRQTFGWGLYLTPLGLGLAGLWLFLRGLGRQPELSRGRVAGALLFFLILLAFFHLLPAEDPQKLALTGQGGGHLGWVLSDILVSNIGLLGAYIVILALFVIALILLSGFSLAQIAGAISRGWNALLAKIMERHMPRLFPPPDVKAASPAPPRREAPSPPLTPSRPGPLLPRIIGGEQEWRPPSIAEIFENGTEHEISQAEIRARVKIIEDTLESFGLPSKVVEVNQGPTVTQFGVEPGYVERKDASGRVKRVKVKVSKISALANDLALALAASPIRIEAPVPGRSIVGIEVPNSELSLVALRTVMESEAFERLDSKLKIALGQDVSGQPVVADLTAMPHLLIAGATGSGKSVCINSIVCCLLCLNTPADLRLIMVDPKMVELTTYNGIPHLISPVVVEVEQTIKMLNWTTREMDRRYKLFARERARHLKNYNEMALARGEKPLPYIAVVIDELADLMMAAPDEIERLVCRIAQMARATGIHLVIATQRPSVDVVTGLIKANFPARISFAVTSQVDSRVVLDTVGAERLLGQGDMLFMPPDSSKLIRLQGCFVSPTEINRLVRYWKGTRVAEGFRPEEMVQRPLFREEEARRLEEEKEEDELLEKAIEVVRKQKRASISLLQRKLRIGYTRAARLIDLLEERGIIAPEEDGRAWRVLQEPPENRD